MWRWIFGLLFLFILGGAGWWLMHHPQLLAGDPNKNRPAPTPTATVEYKDLEESLGASGEVRPALSTIVKSEVSGVVKELRVNAGDHVEKGDLLLALDPKELKSQLDAQQLAVRTLELRCEKWKQEYDRDTQLFEKKMIASKELQDARIDYDMSTTELAVQRANVENIRQQVLKLEIRAPQSGVVLDLEAQVGAVIVGANSFSSGTALMEIADMSRKKATINLNEIDVMKVQPGLNVVATFDSIPGLKLEGKVTFVSPSAGGKSSSAMDSSSRNTGGGSGGNIRTFPVTVYFDQKDDRIRAGITATIKIPLASVKQAPALPISAVFIEENSDQRYVFLKTGPESFERKNITAGINNHEFVEIKDGLKTGDVVALERPKNLPREKKKDKDDDWNP